MRLYQLDRIMSHILCFFLSQPSLKKVVIAKTMTKFSNSSEKIKIQKLKQQNSIKLVLKGSTLIETLLAMAILLTVIGISLNTMAHASSSSSEEIKSKVNIQIDQLLANSIEKKLYTSSEVEIDGISYRQNCSFVNRYSNVVRLEITAERNDQIILERLRYINAE